MVNVFMVNDYVEIIALAADIEGPAPRTRGTVMAYAGLKLFAEADRIKGPWYECEFGGVRYYATHDAIRKVPPDDGRAVVRWDQCHWKPKTLAEFLAEFHRRIESR